MNAAGANLSISAVIPAYNSERHIGRALKSVLQQTLPAAEIIVIDDGSTDGTADAVRGFGSAVRLIQQPNSGVSVARNAGIAAAKGDWIAFLDADDEWLPNKLKLQTECLSRHPELMWAYANFYQGSDDSEKLDLGHPAKAGDCVSHSDYLDAYVHHAYAWTGTVLVNQRIFDSVGLFEPGMKRAQDNDLWFRIAYRFPHVGYCAQPLAVYHLDTPASSTKVNDSVDFMIGLVRRHEQLSKDAGRFEAFRPCIETMVTTWARQLNAQKRYDDAARLMSEFAPYLSARFHREMRLRRLCPPLTDLAVNALMRLKPKP
ncbi:MAG: glycosyltransferase family 2 protein [Planctomycetaceae bacterium]|nr:glycosyltransferase family 2 protein [Planctomycetaceae bacterium]